MLVVKRVGAASCSVRVPRLRFAKHFKVALPSEGTIEYKLPHPISSLLDTEPNFD